MTSPELTGGAGFTYEDTVAAHYLVGLIGGTTATGLASRVVERVAQQQADFGEPLDDVIIDAVGQADGSAMRLSLQVKRALTISSAPSNDDFREVIQRSCQWHLVDDLTTLYLGDEAIAVIEALYKVQQSDEQAS